MYRDGKWQDRKRVKRFIKGVTRITDCNRKVPEKKKAIRVVREESIAAHDVYRMRVNKLDDKVPKYSPIIWHRGAKVGSLS